MMGTFLAHKTISNTPMENEHSQIRTNHCTEHSFTKKNT